MAGIVWPAKPKEGESWITSRCESWRILKATNQSKRADVWPTAYILWDLRTKPALLVGAFQTLEEAKHEASQRAT
jgi:hypothetical protein